MNHFFDIGANVGQTFDWFLSRTNEYNGWTVWCFEPSPRHLASLIAKAKTYADRFQITICPFALSDATGVQPFYEKIDPMADSLCVELKRSTNHEVIPNLEASMRLQVATVSLASFITEHTSRTDKIVLKVDCEGAEYAMLNNLCCAGLARPRIAKIYVEWHDVPGKERQEELTATLRRHGIPVENWPY